MLDKLLRAAAITAVLSILMHDGFIAVTPSYLMADQQLLPQAAFKLRLP